MGNHEFKVERIFTGKRNTPSNIISDSRGAQVVGTKHYGDSQCDEAQALCAVLNTIYERGYLDGMNAQRAAVVIVDSSKG